MGYFRSDKKAISLYHPDMKFEDLKKQRWLFAAIEISFGTVLSLSSGGQRIILPLCTPAG